jgi:hypothetical protein
MGQGVDLPPKTCHTTFVETTTPNMKTSTEFVIIKECGNWIKTAKQVQKPINSWNGIIQMIDDIFDEAVEDYAILHKPFNLRMM